MCNFKNFSKDFILNQKILFGIGASISSFIFFSCEEDADPADTVVPTPVITSISPVEGYPGEEVTITGENFNATAALNLIEIDSNGVSLASVTPSEGTVTSLKFTRPNVSGVGVSISANLKVRNVEDADEKVSDSVSIVLLPIFDIITVAGLPKTKVALLSMQMGTCMHAGKIQQMYSR